MGRVPLQLGGGNVVGGRGLLVVQLSGQELRCTRGYHLGYLGRFCFIFVIIGYLFLGTKSLMRHKL